MDRNQRWSGMRVGRGGKRLVLLLIGACLLGALAGLITSPLESKPAPVAAAPAPPPKAPETPEAPKPADAPATADSRLISSLKPDLTGVWIALLVFGGLGAAVVFVAKKARLVRPGNGAVHLVDTLALTPGRMVHLVRCDGRKYLLGNSERGIHFLASLPQDAAENEIDERAREARPSALEPEGELPFERILAGTGRLS